MRSTLLTTPMVSLECDTGVRAVTLTRTRAELPRDEDGLRGFYRQVVAALDGLDRPRFTLIVDGRAAVGRNDETFERIQAEFRDALFGGFRQVFAIMASVAGQLQVGRYDSAASRQRTLMFRSTEEAYAHLQQTPDSGLQGLEKR